MTKCMFLYDEITGLGQNVPFEINQHAFEPKGHMIRLNIEMNLRGIYIKSTSLYRKRLLFILLRSKFQNILFIPHLFLLIHLFK